MYLIDHWDAGKFFIETTELQSPLPPAIKDRLFRSAASRSKSFLLLPAVLLGLLVIASFCIRNRFNVVGPRIVGRRLADEEDNDIPMPDSPALDAICASTNIIWTPDESFLGGGRESPQMVQEFFSEVELRVEGSSLEAGYDSPHMVQEISRGIESTVHPFVSTGLDSNKRPLEIFEVPDDESVDEEAGLSSRPPKRRRTADAAAPSSTTFPIISPTAPAPAFSAATLPQQASAGAPSHSVQHFPALTQLLVSTSSTTPSSSTPAPAPKKSAHIFLKDHPFVRISQMNEDVKPRRWISSNTLHCRRTSNFRAHLLRKVRDLLLRPSLDAASTEKLMDAAEQLAFYAFRELSQHGRPLSPSDAVKGLGRRYVVLSAIHSVIRVVGGDLPPWWKELTKIVAGNCESHVTAFGDSGTFNLELLKLLVDAVLKYKNGGAPTDEETVQIKYMLFCYDISPSIFKEPEWQPWRDDCTP